MSSCAPACYSFFTRVVRAWVLILGGLLYSGLVPTLAQEVGLAPEVEQVVGSADLQEVGIEWMEFDCGERRCLVINAYDLEEAPPLPDSVISEFDKALSADFRPGRPLREADIGATLIELPIVKAPSPQQLGPFLAKLGLTKLSDFDSMAPHLVVRAIGSSEPELLRAFIEELRSRARFQIENRLFYSREVAGELRNAYVLHGFPSPQRPYFTHLLRGMVTAAEAPTSGSRPYRTVQFQNIEIGTFYYAPIRLVNLGSGPAQVYTTGGFFTGAGVDVEPFTLSPGQEVSRLFRYEAGLMSLFKRRAVVSVIYEAGGVEQEIVRIEGIRSRSLFTSFVSAIRSGVAAHMGYWRDISIYRYTILVVMAGGLLLLLVFGRHLRRATLKDEYGVPLYTEGEQLRAVLDTVRRVTERPRSAIIRLASRADRTSDSTAPITVAGAGVGPAVNGSANGSANKASNGRINGSRNGSSHGAQLARLIGGLYRDTSDEFIRLRERLNERKRQAAIPLDLNECMDRLVARTDALKKAAGDAHAYGHLAGELRREASRLTRKLDSDLRAGRLQRSVKHFQFLWALRLLNAVLGKSESSPHRAAEQWIAGARKVLDDDATEAVGPTSIEFMNLVRELQA